MIAPAINEVVKDEASARSNIQLDFAQAITMGVIHKRTITTSGRVIERYEVHIWKGRDHAERIFSKESDALFNLTQLQDAISDWNGDKALAEILLRAITAQHLQTFVLKLPF